MSKFFSNFEKQIDAKGRVSVPASFRAVVNAVAGEAAGDSIVCFPSLSDDAAIECYPRPVFDRLVDDIENIADSPEAREYLELAITARSVELSFDGEGRVSFPERLLSAAGIGKAVTFVGRGDRFQIWSPEGFAAVEAKALEMACASRHLLMRGRPAAPKAEGAA